MKINLTKRQFFAILNMLIDVMYNYLVINCVVVAWVFAQKMVM